MCGIVAIFGEDVDSPKNIDECLNAISHRGKDNRSVVRKKINDNEIVIGHNRLAINDLSSNGNQPFEWENIILAVNGEIWNYPELRADYEKRGYRFFSNSDSEVILYAYKEDELKRLDGMFSFILLDDDQLIFSRDWIGKIPLFFSESNKLYNSFQIRIGSELKSIYTDEVSSYRIVPKNSLVKINLSTRKLEITHNFYWHLDNPIDVNDCRDLIERAVNKRLLSDVPMAVSLSGGIDSSIISYLVKQQVPDIKLYTIKFDEYSPDLTMARRMSESIGVELVEVEVPKDEQILEDRFKDVLRTIEYPTVVQIESAILMSYVAEAMKKDGIKVVFSGEGADEVFGYEMWGSEKYGAGWIDRKRRNYENQHYRNLMRGNNVFMKYGTIELRMPFYDREFVNWGVNLPAEKDLKQPLKDTFKGDLPESVISQKKRALQKGTNFKNYFESLPFLSGKNPREVIHKEFFRAWKFNHQNLIKPLEMQ